MIVRGDGVVEFARMPTLVIVRRNLSKAGHQYFTFYPEEGCEYLKQSLEFRIRKGEEITGKSPIMTQEWWEEGRETTHLRTVNLADIIRRPIRRAGFKWRPYVHRRNFATRMMVAEMEGMIIRDFRVFWMEHKGDIEHTYTLNKQLPEDVIERMREAYSKAAEKHLVTMAGGRGAVDSVRAQMNSQFLMVAGYTKEEIDALPNPSAMTSEEMEKLMQDKQRRKMGLNGKARRLF